MPRYIQLSAVIFIACLGFIDYSNSFHNSFHLDDFPDIVNNSSIRNIHDIPAIWSCLSTRFITYYSLALNYQWGRLNVFGYHLFNLLVHVGCALLVWRLVILMLRPEETRWIAFFTGLIFLTHPLQTQPVDYIIQRAALLVAFFYLASLVLYAKARSMQRQNAGSQIWKVYYLASLSAGVLSMFSKEIAISLPLMVCCYEFYFLTGPERFNWKMVSPFFPLVFIIPFLLIPKHFDQLTLMQKTVHDFSGGIGPIQYFLTQLRVKVTYLKLLFVPLGQHVEYDYSLSKSIFETSVILSALFLFCILYSAAAAFRRFRLVSFGILWFFITIFPESGFWPNRDLLFEHRLYLPMLGFGLFISSGLFYALGPRHTKFAVGLLALLIIGYSVLTYNRNKVWFDEFTLWDDAVRQDPGKEISYLNRGAAYQNQGKSDKALADYIKALQIDPNDAITYSNLGLIYMDKGDYAKAVFEFDQAIRINSGYAGAFNNRGRVYDKMGELNRAMADYSKAIKIKPDYAQAYNERGVVYRKMGDLAQALNDYNKALAIDPSDAGVYTNRAIVYEDERNFKEALKNFNEAILADHGFALAYYDRAALYQKIGNLDGALSDYNKAIELNINYAEAYNNRGVVYALKGRLDKALADYDKALGLDPHFAAAQKNLAHLMLIQRNNRLN